MSENKLWDFSAGVLENSMEHDAETAEFGIAVMINDDLRNKIVSMRNKEIYTYIIYEDELTMQLDDCIELDSHWYDIFIMLNDELRKLSFEGIMLSDNYHENGCLALLQDQDELRHLLMYIKDFSMDKMYTLYRDCGAAVNKFEDDWNYFCGILRFYETAAKADKHILLFS